MIDGPDATGGPPRCLPAGAAPGGGASCWRCSPSKGTSVLRDVYVINRGYEDLAERLNAARRQRSRPSATSEP